MPDAGAGLDREKESDITPEMIGVGRKTSDREKLVESKSSPVVSENPLVELVGQEFNVGIVEGVAGRPRHARIFNRPNLRHQGRDAGRELPVTNESPGSERTHDVNDEMLAEEYRRGLRVRGSNHANCAGLDWCGVYQCSPVARVWPGKR